MKFLSFGRLFGEPRQRGASFRGRRGHRRPGIPGVIRSRLHLEALEDRTLLAVLPMPVVSNRADISQSGGDQSSPIIAVDPANPNKVVSVYTRRDPSLPMNNQVVVEGRYSTNGGATWTNVLGMPNAIPIPGNLTDPTSSPTNPMPFSSVTDASVAFDRADNFYIVYSEHKGGAAGARNDLTAGAIVLLKYSFSGAGPSRVTLPNQIGIPVNANSTGKVLYEWQNNSSTTTGDPAIQPMLAVDNNLQVDPETGVPDPFAGTVYVAWSTNYTKPNAVPDNLFNANSIKVLASQDGGFNFTSQVYLNSNTNNGGPGTQKDTAPRLVVSQGSASGARPGQLSIVFDDFGTGATATPPFDQIQLTRVFDGAMGQFVQDATRHTIINGVNDPIPLGVSFATNPNYGDLSRMEVTLNIMHMNVGDLAIRLMAPDGTTVTLVAAMSLSGANPGTTASGIFVGTVFEEDAPRTITDTMSVSNPYTGHFASSGNVLRRFYAPGTGLTQDGVNGTWQLLITDNGMTMNKAVVNWSLNFTFGLERNVSRPNHMLFGTAATTPIRGVAQAFAYPQLPPAAGGDAYPLTTLASPDRGVGPSIVIASDNTLGSYSPYQGRLYIAYVGRVMGGGNPDDHTDIFFISSSNGGVTWTLPRRLNDDLAVNDGFSEADYSPTHVSGRPHFQPELAVDQTTGTLVATWYDARYDAARARVARFVTASVDGGQSFSPQTYLNDLAPYVNGVPQLDAAGGLAFDEITRKLVPVGPVPDNESSGNPNKEGVFAFGDHQSVVALGGKIIAAWAGNLNGGNNGRIRQHIQSAIAVIASGPRVVRNTMGPWLAQAGTSLRDTINPVRNFNNQRTADGTPIVDGFVVYFDRPVDPGTFTTGQVTVVYRDVNTSGNDAGTFIPVLSVEELVDETSPLTAAQQRFFGGSKYLVRFVAQSGLGTCSYTAGPSISDRIRYQGTDGGPVTLGNPMDQNPGDLSAAGHFFANPRPLDPFRSFTGSYFRPAFDQDTLPLIVYGPRVILSGVPGNPVTSDNLVLNGTVSSFDVVFDRDMDPASFGSAAIVRMVGPAGSIGPRGTIPASFTITPNPNGSDPDPNFPRTYRINLRTANGTGPLVLDLSGTYTLVLSSGIRSKAGDLMDTNQNAGVDQLRTTPSAGTVPVRFASASSPQPVGGSQVAQMSIPVTDDFVIQGATVQLNITYNLSVSDLEAFLIAPDGTQFRLFSQVGGSAGGGFTDTIFDDLPFGADGSPILSITQGAPPFSGRWHSTQPLSDLGFGTRRSGGTWTLRVRDVAMQGRSGTLNNWNITFRKPVPTTGLGEPVADQATVTFRIFQMDPANPLAHNRWTAVGPASINGNGNSGRIGGLAVDPSDPSGNTVYVAGASGGIWKTTNFLTTDPAGPKYIPLTDFGPTLGVNTGGIAVFGRNNDPNQSIIFVATGEGDDDTPGVGVLRSMDGGATWTVLDSTVNVDSTGKILPMIDSRRDHVFVGSKSYKVIVDPRPTQTGDVLVYAALSARAGGTNGGIWKSTDTGKTWRRMRAGNATDIVADPASGPINIISNPTGNLDNFWAAFRGEGVYFTSDRGNFWELKSGMTGDPLIQNADTMPALPVSVRNRTSTANKPQGPKGRIVLAKPDLTGTFLPDGTYTGNPLQDLIYQGWIYALVATANPSVGGQLDGLYVSKDFGENWTKIRIPAHRVGNTEFVVPTNDDTNQDFTILQDQANYDISLAVDPTNPNIVYVGGDASGRGAGFLRVDITALSDPHSFYIGNDQKDGNGRPRIGTNDTNGSQDPLWLKNWPMPNGQILVGPWLNPVQSLSLPPFPLQYPVVNLIRNPDDPFLAAATVKVSNAETDPAKGFSNSGRDAKWKPFDLGGPIFHTDQHRLITMRDPLTGHARLITGDDQGVWTGVDNNGTYSTGIGTALAPGFSRNGNLQITQFYSGASQPSNLAAQIATAMLYGMAQDDGFPQSDANVFTNGNIQWVGQVGDGASVATDQLGSGTLYMYKFPCCINDGRSSATDFFQISSGRTENGVGQTSGLIQQGPPDPQWPDVAGFPFAVNPIDPNAIVLSSGAGRVFRTTNRAQRWNLIGDVADLDGSNAPGLAFGAPEPNAPADSLSNFIYAGTNNGHIFVTFTGGGGGTGNAWRNVSNGLDGSGVRSIATNPARGSHEAYAVTLRGVYYMADSMRYDPNNSATFWQPITNNLFQITHNIFNPFNEFTQSGQQPTATQLVDTQARYLEAIVADWRYMLPDDPNEVRNPAFPPGPSHPILYVGGEGGVYRSLDKGRTWSLFPNTQQDGSTQDGGFLPNAHVTHLDFALGNVDSTTGRSLVSGPDTLLATTFGRGSFAIRLAPTIVPTSLRLDPNRPQPLPSVTGKALQPIITGMTEQSTFGNLVKVEMFERLSNGTLVNVGVDVNNANQAFTYTDERGRFSIQVRAGYFQADGTSDSNHTFVLRATDIWSPGSTPGVVGDFASIDYNLDTTPFIHPESVRLDPNGPLPPDQGGSDSGLSFTDRITRVTNPIIDGQVDQVAPAPIQLNDVTDPSNPRLVGSGSTNAQGFFSVQVFAGAYRSDGSTDGVHTLQVISPRQPRSSNAVPFTFTLRTTPPATPPAPDLSPDSNTGPPDQRVTRIKTPTFFGTGEARAQVQLYANGQLVGTDFVNPSGNYTVMVSPNNPLADGTYDITVRLEELAGNISDFSPPMRPPLRIASNGPARPTLALDPAYQMPPGSNTSATQPQVFDGTADPGTTVVIKDNGFVIDTFRQGNTNTFMRTLNLAEGSHPLTVESTDAFGNTSVSGVVLITINHDTLDRDRKFIRQLYFNALGRLGTLGEWNIWVSSLVQPNGRAAVANAIEHAPEARDHLVRGWYALYLGRQANGVEEAPWVNAFVSGATEEQVLSGILSSGEYFNRAASIVGAPASNATFIRALYAQLLNRTPAQSEVDLWVNRFLPGSTRQAAAELFLRSIEYRSLVVRSYYANLLRRPTLPSDAEVAGWVNSGLDLTSIRVGFEGSIEFYFRTTGFMP